MASKVYYMNDRATHGGESVPFKAVKLLRDAGLRDMVKPGATVGIKIHTGNYGNSANLRPQWVRAIVEEVQRMGANPVIVETNLNINAMGGDRQDTKQHRKIINRHGFNEQTMGCPIWLCEGPFEFDDVKCEVPHGVYLNHTFTPRRMTKLDTIIVVSHFKGHLQGTYGGAIKNIGIGMASNRGKSATHFLNHPEFGLHTGVVNQEVAQQMMQAPHPNFIDGIINNCAFDCFAVEDGEFVFHREKCKDCSACYYPTLFSGLMQFSNTLMTTTPTCIADSCAGIMNKLGKEKFIFVNYAYDITPSCDCDNKHDAAVIPNIGTFVSRDPVAVDMACLEACEAASVNPGSAFDVPGLAEPNSDRFTHGSSLAQVSQWAQINSGVFNGIGTSEYELVESEPLSEAEVSSWIQDYDFTNPIGKRYRDQIRAFHFDTEGPTAVSEPRLPLEDQFKRPAGLVKTSKISDEQ